MSVLYTPTNGANGVNTYRLGPSPGPGTAVVACSIVIGTPGKATPPLRSVIVEPLVKAHPAGRSGCHERDSPEGKLSAMAVAESRNPTLGV